MALDWSKNKLNDDLLSSNLQTLKREGDKYEVVYLGGNFLETLPQLSQKQELSELKKLFISVNQIRELTIDNIPVAITELDLHRNKLHQLADFRPLVNLQTLRLDSNCISGTLSGQLLPIQIESLNVYDNNIARVHSTQHLHRLKNVFLHRNNISQIDDLPPNIDLITLYRNPIKKLQKGCFTKETMYNTLARVSEHFRYEDFGLSREQIPELKIPPPDIFRKGYQDVMVYFKDDKLMVTISDDTQKKWGDKEKKSLVDTCVLRAFIGGKYKFGKTSLARSLLYDYGCTTHPDDRTVVLDFRCWNIDKKATVTLFDLGGHSCYQQIAHLFHSNCKNNVSVIPHDITCTDYLSTCRWIADVVSRSPKSSIELVLTKSDLVDDAKKEKVKVKFKEHVKDYLSKECRSLTRSKATLISDEVVSHVTQVSKKYESIKEHIDEHLHVVSCKTGDGLDEFRKIITDKISDDKFKVSMPRVTHLLYKQLGKLGVAISQKSKSFPKQAAAPNPDRKERSGSIAEVKKNTEGNLPPTRLQENGDDNSAKEKSKDLQFVTFQAAKDIMKTFVPGTDSKVIAELRSCLRHLHNHGLLFWFEGSEALEQFIFNDIRSFIDLLKMLFNHDVKNEFSYDKLSVEQDQFLHENDISKAKYNFFLTKLHEEGLLSVSLLRILAKKFGFDSNVKTLIEILNHLNISFTIPSEDTDDLEDCWMYFPWYVENKQIPEDIERDISQMKTPGQNQHSIHVTMGGSIPSAFFHCFTVGILKDIKPGSHHHKRRVWKNSFYTTWKNIKVYLEHSRSKDKSDAIDIYITCPPDAENVQKSWEFVSRCQEVKKALVLVWWPGMIDDMYINCRHCKDIDSSSSGAAAVVTPYPWPIDVVMKTEGLGANEKCHCRGDKDENPFPPALIYRIPEDLNEAKKWLEERKKHYDEINQKTAKDTSDIKESKLKTIIDETSKMIKEEKPKMSISGKIAAEQIALSDADDAERAMFRKIYKAFGCEMGKLKVPMYIQHFHPSKYYLKIVLNVEAEKYNEAVKFIKKKCPKFRKYLTVIKQSSKPQFLMDSAQGLDTQNTTHMLPTQNGTQDSPQPNSDEKVVLPGCKINHISCDADSVVEVFEENGECLSNADTLKAILQKKGKTLGNLKMGSLGCLAKSGDKMYAITCQHIFLKKGKILEEKCITNQLVASPSNKKCVYLGTQVAGMYCRKGEYDGYTEEGTDSSSSESDDESNDYESDDKDSDFDNYDGPCVPFIDIAAVLVKETSPIMNLVPSQNNNHMLKVPNVSNESLEISVQKTGSVSKKTTGIMRNEAMYVNVGGSTKGQFFMVKSDQECFIKPGDSGALVTEFFDKSKRPLKAYGICSQIQQICDENKVSYNVALCVYLDECLSELRTNFDLNLELVWNQSTL